MCVKVWWWYLVYSFWVVALPLGAQDWYLIADQELRSIEESVRNWEQDRRNWLSQVSGLKGLVSSLRAELGSLNRQLAQERKDYQTLRRLFEQYEADQLTRLSLKDGEIAGLHADLAAEQRLTERYRGRWIRLLTGVLSVVAGAAVLIGYTVFQRVRIKPG